MKLRLSAVALALTVLAAPAFGQVLPLVAERGGDGVSVFWWSGGTVRLQPLDRALLDALGTSGVDPTRIAGAPPVSQVYASATLGAASARNLGGLFGASSVLVGGADARVLGPVAGDLLWVAEVEVNARWLAVGSDVVLSDVHRTALGEGIDAEAALADARRRVAADVAATLSRRRAAAPGVPEASVDGPVLIVRNPPGATPLVALLSELRERDTVIADLREVWAAEGALAYAVELVPGAPVSALDAVVDGLAADASWGYALRRVGGSGLVTEVQIEALPELTPPPTGAPPAP